MPDSPRRLDQQQFFYAGQWMIANKDRLLRDKPTLAHVARELSAVLKIDVAPLTIRKLQAASAVNWETPSKPVNSLGPRVKVLEDRVNELESIVLRLLEPQTQKPSLHEPAKPPPPKLSNAKMS